jgi:hypothetical protein
MVAGCLVERECRQAVRPEGLNPVVTPIVVASFGLAVPMTVLGITAGSSD